MEEKKIDEIHKMAQIALGEQVDRDCTKWAIKEGFFDNFEALYDAGYRKESDTAKEIFTELFYIASIHHSDVANILAWAKEKAKSKGVEVE